MGTIKIDPATWNITTDQIYPGVNLEWTADETITVDDAIISTRVIGESTDYANAVSTGDSGNVTLTAPEIYIQNNSKIYTQADSGFLGGDVTLNGDASGLIGASDALGIVFFTSSTINANNITAIAKGGSVTNYAFICNSNAEIDSTSSTLISSGDINLTSIAGTSITGSSFTSNSTAEVSLNYSTISSGGEINVSSTGGTATADHYIANVNADAKSNQTDFTSRKNITFTSIAGDATSTDSSARAIATTFITASNLTSNSDIILSSRGGTATTDNVAYVGADTRIYWSTILKSARDIEFNATGGSATANSIDAPVSSYASYYSTAKSGGDIRFYSTGATGTGSFTTSGTYGTSTYLTGNSTLQAGNSIELEATGLQSGENAQVYIENINSGATAGNTNRTLIINADGTINHTSSNIPSAYNGSVINVDEITEGNIFFTSTQSDGPGSIYGAGNLTVYSGYQSIAITNNSNLDLN